jgi:hypothetical protein
MLATSAGRRLDAGMPRARDHARAEVGGGGGSREEERTGGRTVANLAGEDGMEANLRGGKAGGADSGGVQQGFGQLSKEAA